MKCPECGAGSRVWRTDYVAGGDKRRIRFCDKRSHRFTTYEGKDGQERLKQLVAARGK